MRIPLLPLALLALTPALVQAAEPAAKTPRVALGFVERGPAAGASHRQDGGRYFTRARGMTARFEPGAFTIQAHRRNESGAEGVNHRFAFEGAGFVAPRGEGERPGKVNLFLGNDPALWEPGLATFDAVRYANLYPGVDLRVYAAGDRLEYDLLLAPGSAPEAIVVRCEGADALALAADGALLLESALGVLRQEPPLTHAVAADGSRRELDSAFVLLGGDRFGFRVAGWDQQAERLVIDPVIGFSTFLGGGDSDGFGAVATGADGAIYLAGHTLSVDFPTAPGSFDTSFNGAGVGADDAFVVKLDNDATTLLYATFLGGTDGETFIGEFASAIQVNSAGEAYVGGTSSASDFPTTAGALQTARNGPRDGFVVKLGASGAALGYSTYLGGSDADNVFGLALAGSGAVYVTGATASTDFPTSANAFDSTLDGPGWYDGFFAVLDAAGSALTYATFFGGTGEDFGLAVALDEASGAASIVGETLSGDFPTTAGAFGTSSNGGQDVVALKIDPLAPAPDFSTYLGGGSTELGNAVTIDEDGNVYVVGGVRSNNFPVTPGAYDQVHNGGSDAFVTKLTPGGTGVIYSTYLGGSANGFYPEQARAIALTPKGEALLAGDTDSNNFPVAGGDADATLGGLVDAFFATLSANGSSLVYGTHVGGAQPDFGFAVAMDKTGRTFLAGQTASSELTGSEGVVQESFGGGYSDAYLASFEVPCTGGFATYGTGCPGTGGIIPELAGRGCPEPGYDVRLEIREGLGGAVGFLLAGSGQGAFTLKNGCTFEVLPLIALVGIQLSGAGGGNGTLDLAVPIPEGQPPLVVHLQAIFADPGNPWGISGTNGLSIGISTQP